MNTHHTCTSTTDNWPEVKAVSERILGEDLVQFIEECRKSPEPHSQLIAVLHRVQAKFGYLGASHLDAVAQLMQIPAAKVSGVASFYHYFRLQPRGKFIINLCLGTACYVKGADRLAEKLKDELGIHFGETTSDGLFTLEGARCLGACSLAPVLTINDEMHGTVTPDQIPIILDRYIKRAREETQTSPQT
ncbi:NAD-reducing hydrogenase subunit HoxE [Thermogutta terrifontis]|jgi:NADH:ubiquinone oxidoreductase subunit E|uniref:NAD-reducing hydrogenase subunit HoxE n=1 Tax=Thermogutta terrifontis TaxID=1331910 RepID=A0A286RKF3_9BACT|nr:NADH-quinone oxidoreductase subunit NuoE [Thermogutta terrifontis]ASV76445.1 NAD-reducing hydrogenase subunit HoxE [Thermogutta terrifontis]